MRIVPLILFVFSCTSFARVFNLHSQTSATYVKGNYGSTNLQQDTYTQRSGANTLIGGEMDFSWGGEIGFMSIQGPVGFRLGLSVINPQKITTKGNNSSGTELMTLSSEVYGIYPVAHVDYYFFPGKISRAIFSFGGGYGKVLMKNDYTLTTAGTTAYGINSFKETAETYTYMLETSIAYELEIANSLSIAFDIGYRYSKADSLEYKNDVTNFSGNQSSGDVVKYADGQDVSLDLSGFYSGLTLRFYFNF